MLKWKGLPLQKVLTKAFVEDSGIDHLTPPYFGNFYRDSLRVQTF